jgi:3-oxoacyl-[acyl-carrier protein] reductase
MLLEKRVAVVTGASRGIGAATARLLARHGAAVGVNYFRSEAPARAVVEEIVAAGGRAVPLHADAREREDVERMAREAEDALGPVDTLVVNASIGFPVKPFLQFSWDEFAAKLTGELRAAFHACQVFVPGMAKRGTGCVVLVSSGLSRHPGEGFVAHSTAKSGLDAFGKSLALELGPKGVRVNVVAPGLTDTDATAWLPEEQKKAAAARAPLRRIGLPEDVAGAVLFLASDEARFITGTYLPVSGGMQMI